MKTVKVVFDNNADDYMITQINGSREQILKYYLGNMFNMGTEKDEMKRATSVAFLDEEN